MRNIVVGGSSRVWKTLSTRSALAGWIAIGHADLSGFVFTPLDRVWVLSYSRHVRDNSAMLARLGSAGVANRLRRRVGQLRGHGCYAYAKAKLRATFRARAALEGNHIGEAWGRRTPEGSRCHVVDELLS